MTGEKLLFEREDAEQAAKCAPHFADTSLAPGPRLGRDQVDHGNPSPVQLARDPEVKIGGIGEEREVRPLRFGRP